MRISVIIPILNEAENIGGLLRYLIDNSAAQNIKEIIVVDGGSVDGSPRVVSNFSSPKCAIASLDCPPPDIKLIYSEKGRARQMNTGARQAQGEILYFLHADSFPPKNFDTLILNQLKDEKDAGCFRMRFDNPNPILKISQWFTRFNIRICRGGDQSLFISKAFFDKLGGYDELYRVYEDNEFIGRVYRTGNFSVIPEYIMTSSRRYEKNGNWRLQYHFTRIHLKKLFGATPDELYQYYQQNIAS